MRKFFIWLCLLSPAFIHPSCTSATFEKRDMTEWPMKPKPLIKDFIGLNTHIQFKPELYAPVANLVRSYHNIDWDVKKTGDSTAFPTTVNGIDWDKHVYGKWKKYGYGIDASLQFQSFGSDNPTYKKLWNSKEKWQHYYGFNLAKYFGPSGERGFLNSVEIGNEPGRRFDDELYKKVFKNIAQGIREADPNLKILTCAVQVADADDYIKQLSETFSDEDIKKLYDVINVHAYALKPEAQRKHPWERSFPEDPTIDFLYQLEEAIVWRNENSPDKEIWITEFGWDAVTEDKLEKRKGGFKKYDWQGVTDLQQAQYIIRAILCFTEADIQRAYVYYFNDNNAPAVHASSGITRKFEPKISFWALKHFQETLGEYKFNKVIKKESGEVYVYEFVKGDDQDQVVWVAWSPTGTGSAKEMTISELPQLPSKIEKMPDRSEKSGLVEWEVAGTNSIKLIIDESPSYIFLGKPNE